MKPPDPKQAQTPQPGCRQRCAGHHSVRAVDGLAASKVGAFTGSTRTNCRDLWTSKEENVYDLLALERQVLFSDRRQRPHLPPHARPPSTLVAETNESETTRLLPSEHSMLAATGNMGRIFRLGETPGASGS